MFVYLWPLFVKINVLRYFFFARTSIAAPSEEEALHSRIFFLPCFSFMKESYSLFYLYLRNLNYRLKYQTVGAPVPLRLMGLMVKLVATVSLWKFRPTTVRELLMVDWMLRIAPVLLVAY